MSIDANEIVVGSLRDARSKLLDQRADLDHAISELDALIAARGGDASAAGRRRDPGPTRSANGAPTMIDGVAEIVIAAGPTPVRADYVVDATADRGWAPSSIRKALTSLVERGVIERAGRGLYRARTNPGGAVDATPPGTVPATRSGGDEDETAPSSASTVPQDHGPTSGERDDRDHHRLAD